jgi:hypothetical protein
MPPCSKTNPLNPMEATMQYKTIVLALLERRPEIHDRLRRERMLLKAMEFYAGELKALHEDWKQQLSATRPGSDESQLASEALEMALKELEGCLPAASSPEESGQPSVENLLAFLKEATPPA